MKHQIKPEYSGYSLIAEFIESDNQRKFNFIIMASQLSSTCIDIAQSILKNNSIEHFAVFENKTGKIVWSTYKIEGHFEKGAWISDCICL